MYTPLEKIGLICLSVVAFQIARTIVRLLYNNLIGPAMKRNVNLKEMGHWAVVTGATDGVGKAYAKALAKLGIDIVLISRTKTKLEAVAAEIESQYHVSTKIIEADFSDDSHDVYHTMEKELYGMEIGVLINNVGMSYPYPEYFLELPDRDKVYPQIIKCNISSVTNMTMMILPQMVERKKGVVVNVSSTAAIIPSPMLTIYGASKAFIEKFSKDLACEYGKHGIVIQCILPGYVATKMSKIKRSTWMAPTPGVFAKHALRTIGIQQQTTGYFPHTLMVKRWEDTYCVGSGRPSYSQSVSTFLPKDEGRFILRNVGAINFMGCISPSFAQWVIVRTMETIRGRALNRHQR